MTTLATIVSALGGAGAILAGLVRVAGAIFKVIAESKQLRTVVLDNTEATKKLSGAQETLASQNRQMLAELADHETRIARLEGAPARVSEGIPPHG